MKMEFLGRHILVEYYNCDEEILKDHKLVEEYMIQAAKEAQATVVESCFHHFNLGGACLVQLLLQNHTSQFIHGQSSDMLQLICLLVVTLSILG